MSICSFVLRVQIFLSIILVQEVMNSLAISNVLRNKSYKYVVFTLFKKLLGEVNSMIDKHAFIFGDFLPVNFDIKDFLASVIDKYLG